MLSDERIREYLDRIASEPHGFGLMHNMIRQISTESSEAMRERCAEYAGANANRMFSGELAAAIRKLPTDQT